MKQDYFPEEVEASKIHYTKRKSVHPKSAPGKKLIMAVADV